MEKNKQAVISQKTGQAMVRDYIFRLAETLGTELGGNISDAIDWLVEYTHNLIKR